MYDYKLVKTIDELTDDHWELLKEAAKEHRVQEEIDLDYVKDWAANFFFVKGLHRYLLVIEKDTKPVAVLAAYLAPAPLVPAWIAQSVLVHVLKEYRYNGRLLLTLLDSFEEWAKRIGASAINISIFEERGLGHILEKRGYKDLGVEYIREI